jgi:dTDP-4-amino-4,6-dideoxygalactose transaminase
MKARPEDALLAHYDAALATHGDTPQGALWPNGHDRLVRFDVLLDLLSDRSPGPVVLCDLGCGTGELLARIRERGLPGIRYVGVDRSARALALARAKFPRERFVELDVTDPGADLAALECDYLIANGLFTVKHNLSDAEMSGFLREVLEKAWPRVRRGLAVNVMSPAVDWRRDDLYHASMDDMARLLHGLAGRRVRMRADYGLYEYACFATRETGDGPRAAGLAEVPAPAPAGKARIPVLRPRLASADALLPYLRRIDAARVYSNFGPLVTEFEARLGEQLGLAPALVATAANGTAALAGAILGCVGRATPARPRALVPAYTFIATAVAVEECGFEPCLADVHPGTWMLEPEAVLARADLDRVGLVVPVAAYGRRVDSLAWARFAADTGIAVVIDAAAGFESIADGSTHAGDVPLVLSFHATKSLGTGEGGCVLTTDAELAMRVGRALNFGFYGSRDSVAPSVNGKMSEYHAAVGLAELDAWPEKSAALRRVAESYRRHAAGTVVGPCLRLAPDVCSSYALLHCGDAARAARARAALDDAGIEHRLWYGLGLHRHAYYAARPRIDLPVTDALAPTLVGLPVAVDLEDRDVARIIGVLTEALAP